MTERPQWFTSSYSGGGGNCVELAVNLVALQDIVPVRDSKCVDGPVVDVRTGAFSAFVASVRAGAFDAV